MNQYLETIELRTTGQNRERLKRALEKLMIGLDTDSEQEHMRVYNSLALESDFCIHLHVLSDHVTSEGSPLGIRIVSTLKEYGLIHHNIWYEMLPKPIKS